VARDGERRERFGHRTISDRVGAGGGTTFSLDILAIRSVCTGNQTPGVAGAPVPPPGGGTRGGRVGPRAHRGGGGGKAAAAPRGRRTHEARASRHRLARGAPGSA